MPDSSSTAFERVGELSPHTFRIPGSLTIKVEAGLESTDAEIIDGPQHDFDYAPEDSPGHMLFSIKYPAPELPAAEMLMPFTVRFTAEYDGETKTQDLEITPTVGLPSERRFVEMQAAHPRASDAAYHTKIVSTIPTDRRYR